LERETSIAVEIKTNTIIKRKIKRKKTRNKRSLSRQPGVLHKDLKTSNGIINEATIQEPVTPRDENAPVILNNVAPANEATSEPTVKAAIESGLTESEVPDQSFRETEPIVLREEIPEDDVKISQGHWFPGIQSLNSPQVYQSSLTDIIGTYTVNNIPKGDHWELPPPLKIPVHKNAVDIAADGIEKGLDFIGNCVIYPVDKIIRLFSSKPRNTGK
jgi:hypothetical protein